MPCECPEHGYNYSNFGGECPICVQHELKKEIKLLRACLDEMPDCKLEFKSKKEMDAWDAWKAKHKAAIAYIPHEGTKT